MFAIDVFLGGHISFNGRRFSPKPKTSVPITVWIKVNKLVGDQSVFATIGGKNAGNSRYHLEIKPDGGVRWFNRNVGNVGIFNIITKPIIKIENWAHLAVTYDGGSRLARVG